MKASVLADLGRFDEAYDLLDVSGLNPPLVYEWLYFAHQVHVVAIRGKGKPDSFTTLRDYWSRDGLIAIVGGTAELVRAEQDGRPGGAPSRSTTTSSTTVRPLWHEWFQARLRLTATVIGIHATAAAQQSVGRARGVRRRRTPHAERRRARHRLLRRVRHGPRSRIPGLGGAPRRPRSCAGGG